MRNYTNERTKRTMMEKDGTKERKRASERERHRGGRRGKEIERERERESWNRRQVLTLDHAD